jgi:excisionase family DNA binding protein
MDAALLSVREAMEKMGIRTRHEFNKLIENKKLPYSMKGTHIRVSPEDVERYLSTVKAMAPVSPPVTEAGVEEMDKDAALLTVNEVIEILGISRATFYTLLKERKLSYYKVGKRLRFSREDLKQYLAANYTPGIT